MEKEVYETNMERAERLNGLLAMLGVVAALGAYAVTGQVIPGLWWILQGLRSLSFCLSSSVG